MCDSKTSYDHCVEGFYGKCQEGFGSCSLIDPPSCTNNGSITDRVVGYYQVSNLQYRLCDQVTPDQINTKGFTHLFFAFASIDPSTYEVTPVRSSDADVYSNFTDLKSSKLETWIAIGGSLIGKSGEYNTTW